MLLYQLWMAVMQYASALWNFHWRKLISGRWSCLGIVYRSKEQTAADACEVLWQCFSVLSIKLSIVKNKIVDLKGNKFISGLLLGCTSVSKGRIYLNWGFRCLLKSLQGEHSHLVAGSSAGDKNCTALSAGQVIAFKSLLTTCRRFNIWETHIRFLFSLPPKYFIALGRYL